MGNYVLLADIRGEGAPSSVSDATINARIAKWEAIVEKLTRNVFRVLTPGELTFDGNNAGILHFNLPIITLTSIYINEETTALDSDDYRLYNGRSLPQDDRHNPKIELTGLSSSSVFTRSRARFVKGLDQKITATWGFTESDDSCPTPIVEAIKELVTLDLDGYFDKEPNAAVTPVRKETTDGHSIEYQNVAEAVVTWAMMPQSIASVLSMYRAPTAMATPDRRQMYDPEIVVYSY